MLFVLEPERAQGPACQGPGPTALTRGPGTLGLKPRARLAGRPWVLGQAKAAWAPVPEAWARSGSKYYALCSKNMQYAVSSMQHAVCSRSFESSMIIVEL